MLFQNKHVFCLVMTLAFSSSFSSFPDYAFQVNPVKKCPMNKEAWDISSARMNCNKTHGYHCVPNKILSSLIEFCYPRGKNILFEKGNCLELAGTGILNHVSCKNTFSSGCPDSFYYGNEIYKYPKCLAINTTLRCFDSDTQCIGSRLMEQNTTRQNSNSEQNRTAEQSGNLTTQYSSEGSTVQNIINEWNITGDQSGNLTQMILKNSTVLVEQNSVERNGTGKQTDSRFTKNSLENSHVLVTILSILLSVSILALIVVSLKRNEYLMTRIKCVSRRNRKPDRKSIEMQTTYNISSPIPIRERYEIDYRSPRVLDEDTHRACSSLLHERESSTQSTVQTFSSQSNEESDSDLNYEDVNADSKGIEKDTSEEYLAPIRVGKNNTHSPFRCNPVSDEETYGNTEPEEQCNECVVVDNQEGSNQKGPQLFPLQFHEQIERGCEYEENSSECAVVDDQEGSNQKGPQLFHEQIDRRCEYEEYTSESKNGSNGLNEIDTKFSERYVDVVNPQLPANENAVHLHQLKYSNIDNPACSRIESPRELFHPLKQDKLGTRVINKEKRKPVVVITEKESKQTKEVATSKRTKSITSSHSTKKSEEKKRAVLSSDKNKGKKKRGQISPRKHIKREDEWRRKWENEQENNRQRDIYMKRLAREMEMLRRDLDQLEKEKLEWPCREKLRREQQLERDRFEREQEEKKRIEQLRRDMDQLKKEKLEWQCREMLRLEQLERDRLEREQEDKRRIEEFRLYDDSGDRDQVMDYRENDRSSEDRQVMDNFSKDSRPEKRSTLEFERERDRISTRYEWRDSSQRELSDRQDERDRDRRGARTLLKDSGHKWKSEKDSASNLQRSWAGSADRSNVGSSWSLVKMKRNRILGFQPQDRWTWNDLGLQADRDSKCLGHR